MKINAASYFYELIQEFPILEKDINSEDPDMIHTRMEYFSDYTNSQIGSNNNEELKRCFSFQESRVEHIDDKLLNALKVSYCESLLLGKYSSQMERVMGFMEPKFRELYLQYEIYYRNIFNKNN
ncbi:hypothetical protein [uncultured Aquimarina sp.]|uniref:DUF7674 family protein n=1 Tax=uncultured Aquimarina sp. TaxID=575652 RepID=UPI0026336E0C|nr:hypothetical protein [uncultured Aquimarina sp.]